MLEIDLKIILAQIVTFLIGVFVLWKIAWKPLVEILAKRKYDISKNISDAQNLKIETEKLKNDYEQMLKNIDGKAQELIQKAITLGDENKQKIITESQIEAKKILDSAKKQIEYEREAVKMDLRREIVPIAISIAEKVTEKLIDKNTKKELIEKFLQDISKQ
ncbi:MAG: ATP synthase F0 subunit B [Elusimicrobia bacterium CG06_land_8_20_14_3_00_38_11]|nr:MAG: ATP synthase F0 subunit B [Elusimicrobia bacterium CG06_land_8_20_14_3_00_38_11]